MNYTITFDKTTKDEPVLVVSRPDNWFGSSGMQVVNLIDSLSSPALIGWEAYNE